MQKFIVKYSESSKWTLENLEDAEKKSPSAGLVSLVEFVHVFVCIMSGPGTEQWEEQEDSGWKRGEF